MSAFAPLVGDKRTSGAWADFSQHIAGIFRSLNVQPQSTEASMRRTALCTIAIAFFCAFQAAPAQAQPARVFVAAQGLDSNPCTFSQPCRSFQHAHDVVAAGGEIDVLDPAGYGAVTITKAISIQGHGFAGLAVPSGDGITVSPGPIGRINLRGLLLDGIASGGSGITYGGGGSLYIQDCLIRNFSTS